MQTKEKLLEKYWDLIEEVQELTAPKAVTGAKEEMKIMFFEVLIDIRDSLKK